MLALHAQDASSGLELKQLPVPSLGPEDVLIKVYSAGITPGVMKLLKMGQSAVPTTVGHEAAGVVEALGENVKDGLTVGDRVRLHPILSCGECHQCQLGFDSMCDEAAQIGFAKFGEKTGLYAQYHDGALAEYVRVPRKFVDRLPDNVSFDIGAKLHDAATALRVLKLAEITKPNSAIILTAPTGTMGTVTLKLAKFFPNIKKIILVGRSKERLESVQHLTEVETVAFPISAPSQDSKSSSGPPAGTAPGPPQPSPIVRQLRELAPEGISAIIDYVPAGPTLSQILPALATRGTIVHMGGSPAPLQIPLVFIMSKAWRLVGNRAHTRDDAQKVLDWLQSDQLVMSDLITHRFSLKEAHRAIEAIETRDEHVWMSIIEVIPEKARNHHENQTRDIF
jgi:threonine dehydrogenase-like Zn-dependent dehydrogenase